jgi:uracil-DNA glycosylase
MAGTDAPVGAQEWVPPEASSIEELKSAAAGCKGCELYADATQTVFGRGAPHAKIVFVGEQPGDVEDQRGLPGPAHIAACRPWLVAEFSLLKPELVVILGATAGRALLGPSFRVTQQRGRLMPWPASAQHPEDFPVAQIQALATFHPSAVLRADDRDTAYRSLVDDLKIAASAVS